MALPSKAQVRPSSSVCAACSCILCQQEHLHAHTASCVISLLWQENACIGCSLAEVAFKIGELVQIPALAQWLCRNQH